MGLRIFIADDHTMLVEGLRLILGTQPDLTVVGSAPDGLRTVRDVEVLRPDIVLMDISMPGMNGITATELIRASHPEIRVVILTMHRAREHVYGALRAGASAYVLKESAGRELVDAIRRVAAGQRYLGSGVVDLVAVDAAHGDVPAAGASLFELLSTREMQVLQLLVEGHQPKEIGAILDISAKTVDTYRRRLMTKLGVDSFAALIRLAVRHGIAGPDR